MRYLNSPKWNLFGIVILTILSTAILWTSDLGGVGMGWLIIMYLPVAIGIVTYLVYLLSRIFTKRYNWTISIIGMAFSLFLSIQFHFFNN